ncbi:hypothetical protein T03_14271 [Trichinella britovi]|uniref:Uncharacterized protein n=1 Tax=Trichinella britovi TaxID=45882 RepID=A0A0V1D5L7_TRIBR|nr:hypothetical protein T03_14271 [Trichinella britovi]
MQHKGEQPQWCWEKPDSHDNYCRGLFYNNSVVLILRKGWSHLGSILFPFGPTVHLLVVVLAILLVRNLAILLDRKSILFHYQSLEGGVDPISPLTPPTFSQVSLNSSASHFPQTLCVWLYSDRLHTIDRNYDNNEVNMLKTNV